MHPTCSLPPARCTDVMALLAGRRHCPLHPLCLWSYHKKVRNLREVTDSDGQLERLIRHLTSQLYRSCEMEQCRRQEGAGGLLPSVMLPVSAPPRQPPAGAHRVPTTRTLPRPPPLLWLQWWGAAPLRRQGCRQRLVDPIWVHGESTSQVTSLPCFSLMGSGLVQGQERTPAVTLVGPCPQPG